MPDSIEQATRVFALKERHGAMRFFTKLEYLLRETFLGLRRGGWMNWAAVSMVTVLLFLFGMSLQASWQLESLLTQFGSQLEVSAYLETGVSADVLRSTVERFPEVASVEDVTKEEAWSRLVKELGLSNLRDATQQLEGNPLVDELKVKARSSEVVPALAEKLKKVRGVDEVQYVSEAVQRIAQLNTGFNRVSTAIVGLLTATAIAVINTTIRFIVVARRKEIEIMQLVGATRSWIYLPFLAQGVAFGIFGSAIAFALIQGIQKLIRNQLSGQAEFVQFLTTGATRPIDLIALPLILLTFGGLVGLLGSIFAVRRFAKI
ncbi:cell division protein FtsX [Leptolyngbya sp. FACHB-1624]|uniref:cell division protein FtsX n=2 Tax=Leptolyngbya group TaxID=3081713 RepID=UPI0018EF6F64|nr:ABC transporter permease [Leptolyngbya sp. FACHB-1624]